MYSDRINPDIDDLVIWNVFLNCIVTRMDLFGSGWIKPKPFRCQALRRALREGHAVVNERW